MSCSHESESSDTDDTDDEFTWGGLGRFEYSQKGLPHALMHQPELVMRGGHYDAFCTFRVEASHPHNIKLAARYARCFASVNKTQIAMLDWVLLQRVWSETILLPSARESGSDSPVRAPPTPDGPAIFKLSNLLTCGHAFDNVVCNNRTPARWGKTFVSSQVRMTRTELLSKVCVKLNLPDTLAQHAQLVKRLYFKCYGELTLRRHGEPCKYAGISKISPGRRDFVRVKGTPENNTCLSAQVLMFVHISGFRSTGRGIRLPDYLTTPQNEGAVTLALIRWLSPHRGAIMRDDRLRPVCPPPFDFNHALWTFYKLPNRRPELTREVVKYNLQLFEGDDVITKRRNLTLETHAGFDLIQPESFNRFLNCTVINESKDAVLETITLPF